MHLQNLKFVAFTVPEIIGYPKNLDSHWIRPRSIFSEIFDGLLFDGPMNVPAKFEVRSYTRS